MSADLLAAFGSSDDLEANIWNDSKTTSRCSPQHVQPVVVEATWQAWPQQQGPAVAQAAADTTLWKTNQDDNDVLFDAEAGEPDSMLDVPDDDFGAFEEADTGADTFQKQATPDKKPPNHGNLLGLKSTLLDKFEEPVIRAQILPDSSDATMRDLSPSRHMRQDRARCISTADDYEWGAFEDVDSTVGSVLSSARSVTTTTSTPKHVITETRLPVAQNVLADPLVADNYEDDFDAWDEFEHVNPAMKASEHSPSKVSSGKAQWNTEASQPNRCRDRPTNIPPPVILISLIPKVISSLVSRAQDPKAVGDVTPQAIETYRVCARLIAGRSLRWKRDTNLAQSMRIGAAGRGGGMKLTVLDKGETMKEEQAVEEALASWSRSSSKLNTAILKAKLQKPPMSLSTNFVIRTASGPDVLSAMHVCPICGLKRNERINGIEVGVSDIFGEFWIEHWGHKDCYNFWYRCNELLDQR